MFQGVMKCMKYFLFLFNLTFVVIGIIHVTVGILTINGFERYVHIALISELTTPPTLFIVVGVIIFFIGFVGCCIAANENHCMMMTYSVLVGLLLVVELGAAFADFALQDDVERLFEDGFVKTQKKYDPFGNETGDAREITRSWDAMQHNLQCCGTHNFTDWGTIISAQNQTYEIPQSCCKDDVQGCSIDVKVTDSVEKASGSISTTGCLDKAVSDIAIRTLGIIGICSAVVELLGVICACFIARSIRYSYETV